MNIILATTSMFRKKYFYYLDRPFTCEDSDVDESVIDREVTHPESLVRQLAEMKARSVYERHRGEESVVLGFDSVGYLPDERELGEGVIQEKPKSKGEAFERLKLLSGKRHLFYTGVCAIPCQGGVDFSVSEVTHTNVQFREIEDYEIERFLNNDEHYMHRALIYSAFEGYSSSFVKETSGDFSNLASGLPLSLVEKMLSHPRLTLGVAG